MPRWVKSVVVAVAILIGGTYLWWQMDQGTTLLRLDGQSYHLAVMRSEADLEKGLSGTDSLPEGQAMLFVFPRADKWAIWMKDMKYPIDIVWLDGDKQVIHTVKNALPSSYPQAFTPEKNANYVIELPSGTIERTGIRNGDPAGLPSGV